MFLYTADTLNGMHVCVQDENNVPELSISLYLHA
jgi:hypothetical protein